MKKNPLGKTIDWASIFKADVACAFRIARRLCAANVADCNRKKELREMVARERASLTGSHEAYTDMAKHLADYMGCSESVARLLVVGEGLKALQTYEQEVGGFEDYEWMVMINACSQSRSAPS